MNPLLRMIILQILEREFSAEEAIDLIEAIEIIYDKLDGDN